MNFKVVGIGEVLWDLLPSGRQLGGAPANFAYHARMLGADARIISRVGDDQAGRDIIERLKELGVPSDCIERDREAPTSTVSVQVAPDGQPWFTIHENVAWDCIAGQVGLSAVMEADAVCFGTLAQRSESSRLAIQELLKATRSECLRIFDINLRQHFFSRAVIEESLALSNVLKVNETELPQLAKLLRLSGGEQKQICELSERYRLRLIAYTRGDRGSLLYAGGEWSDHPGVPTRVADTVGAGDSFTAAMTLGFLAGWPLGEINDRANQIAAYVASRPGATPELPQELRAPFLLIAQIEKN